MDSFSAYRSLGDPQRAAVQEMSVIDLIQNQLSYINMLLAATILKVGANQTNQSPGVVVNSNFNSPQLVIDMLQKINTHAQDMTALIAALKNDTEMAEKKKQMDRDSLKSFALKGLLIGSTVVFGFIILKNVRSGRPLF